LRTLELGYNPLGPEGVAAVAGAFKTADARIEALKLGWCKAGPGAGAAALADLLLLNSSLNCLDLRGNSLGNDGAVLIARALRSHANPRLEELDLGYNEVRDDGACALAQALKANAESAPAELRMAQNYVTRFGQVALQEAVDMVFELGKGRKTSVQF
jgi:Ran GTPase-activating protein (RanGAP) involved in mRNA processing and transport